MSNVSLAGGAVNSNSLLGGAQVLSGSAATVSLDPTAGALCTLTPTVAQTVNAASQAAGAVLVFVVTTSGTTSYNVTFGTGFKSTAVLATGTVSAKVFTVTFVSDGVNFNEVARTTAM